MASGGSSASPDRNASGCVLLDVRAYSAAIRNASTASSKTSTGHPIEVTFCIARPPDLSYFSVYCPALQAMVRDDSSLRPKAIVADADLVLFRVPVNTLGKLSFRENDYFVYRAHPLHPKLDLIPKSPYSCLGDNEIAVMSCADDGKQYILAGLKARPGGVTTFGLQLYRSKPDGGQGSWSYQLLSVKEPLRDRVCPIPDTAQRLTYHVTAKVIILGGPKGTVGWVDLWRGIILCDVLEVEESRKLLDMPFPLPAKGNWKLFLNSSGDYCRDVTVSRRGDCIKYVEMEIIPPRMVTTAAPGAVNPDTYLEWLRLTECPSQQKYKLVPGNWKVTVWSMPIPVTTWEDWHRDCAADMANLHVDIKPEDYELLHKLSSNHKEASEATMSLGSLLMAYPTMSMDGDVVYLLTKATEMGKDMTKVVTAVDVKGNTLCGLAKLDSRKITCYLRCCLATRIFKHIKSTGIYVDRQEKIDIVNCQNVEKISSDGQVRDTSIGGVCDIGNSTTSDWLEGYGTTHTIRFGTIENIGNYHNVEKMADDVQVRGTSIGGVCDIGNSITSDWLNGRYGTTHSIMFGTIECDIMFGTIESSDFGG